MDEDKLACEDKDNEMTALPILEMKEEFQDKVVGVVVRVDVQLFIDQVSNVLATANNPHHSGGYAHLLDNEERYCDRVGDNTATLSKAIDRPKMPELLVTTTTVQWKFYEQMKKVYNVETYCRDECIKFIVKRYPVIMEHLKNKFDALPLILTLQAAFKHIFSNVTDDVVDSCEEYVKTHVVLLSLSFQASDRDGLSNSFKQVTKLLRRLKVLDAGKE